MILFSGYGEIKLIEINNENLLFIIRKILDDDFLFKKLRKEFPPIVGDLVSFKYNPNCSCRSKVLKYFEDKLKENKNILGDYVSNMNGLEKQLQEIENNKEKILSGKIFTIPKKSWEEFAKSIEGKHYRSFSMVEKNQELKLYFL